MKRYLPLVILPLFLLLAPKALAGNAYYVQDSSNGELFMGSSSFTMPRAEDYWTPDRINYTELNFTVEPWLFTDAGATATTTTDQFVDHINFWISSPSNNKIYNAYYTCNSNNVANWSNDFDGSVLTNVPQKITFTFPHNPDCNLKNYHVASFGIYTSGGYPEGLYFLASNTNPTPKAGLFNFPSVAPTYLEDYDIKAEVWTLGTARTPILIVPGVLGTDLKKGDDLLWANLKMARGFDSFMDPLAFNSNLSPLDNSITLGSVIKEKGVPGFISDYTNGLVNQLISPGLGYTEGKDLFTFPYDWRFGVSEDIANQLKGQINYILTQTEAGKSSGKVDIVAHSTGALVVKKYVQQNPIDHHINKAVFVGIPNLGAPKAFKLLINGDSFDVLGLDPDEMKKIGQNMPVVYDLAPTQEYDRQIGSFLRITNPSVSLLSQAGQDVNYIEAIREFDKHNLVNDQAILNSKILHTVNFDNMDLRSNGIDLYNIIGCKNPTFGKFTEMVQTDSSSTFDFPKLVSGDKTVPLLSADSLVVDSNKTYFAPKISHGDLLSANGSRQQIVNLLTGSNLSTNGKILDHSTVQQDPSKCEIKGESINIKSPVAVGVTDQAGNFSGLAEDGSIQNDIPGADYEIWGEHKYVFLPTDEGQQYQINLKGTGTGTFTIDDQSINGDIITQTQVFSNIPVTPDLTGQVNLGSTTTLNLRSTPTSTPEVIEPSSIINSDQSLDQLPPVSTSTISGIMGQPGFYRSSVNIMLSAVDSVVPGHESETSGILNTHYNLDNSGFVNYGTSTLIAIAAEGPHTLQFFSTDRAGNNEIPQTLNFTIDTTAPEAVIQFNPAINDLQFTAADNISTSTGITILDNDDNITLTDQAGNTTNITLTDKDRKKNFKGEIKSLFYNGVKQDLSKNILRFNWSLDKNQNLKTLNQQVRSKQDFSIQASYQTNTTQLSGKDQTGQISKTLTGLILLKLTTNKGDLNWSY